MSACVSKSFHLSSPLKIDESNEKQGIVSILGSDCQNSRAAASLGRTFSADMSSKKWLAQNGFHSMKKIASSEVHSGVVAINLHHSSSSSSSEEVKGNGHNEIWASIQSQKDKEKNGLSPSEACTWGSILTQKQEDSSNLPLPYIHPLVKRSTSHLSERSLQLCTESLGSETGSDLFSSYPPSETGDQEEEKDNGLKIIPQSHQQKNSFKEMQIVKYNYSCSNKFASKSFPPPLPSLACQDGGSLQMQSHRKNGRLVLEAVSIPTRNYFRAQREDGRLFLTLVGNSSSQDKSIGEMEDEVQEFDQVFDEIDEIEMEDKTKYDGEEEEGLEEGDELTEEENEEFEIEEGTKLTSGVINVHKATCMMKKFMGLENKNMTWSPTLINKAHVKLLGVKEEDMMMENKLTQLPQSLPQPPRVARLIAAAPPTATSFNAYEYFWREKSPVASIIEPISEECNLKNNYNKVTLTSNLKGYQGQNLVFMRGDKEDLLPQLRRCNEPKRSLLFREPYCVATS